MLLEGKNAVIYGGGGSVGGAVARTFAREGARVFLAGRTGGPMEVVAKEIAATGGRADTALVDAMDGVAVEKHMAAVVAEAGWVDVSFNAITIRGDLQGVPLTRMSQDDFAAPIKIGTTSLFLTATAAARRMTEQGSGAIVTLSTSAAGLAGPLMGGFGVACAAIESFTRCLAGEVGPQGVRVVCLRSEGLPETWPEDFRSTTLDPAGEGYGTGKNRAQVQATLEGWTLLKRLPTLAQLADTAAFLASDRAGAMTGVVADITCGALV